MPAQTRIIHFYVCLGAAGGKECEVIINVLRNSLKKYLNTQEQKKIVFNSPLKT